MGMTVEDVLNHFKELKLIAKVKTVEPATSTGGRTYYKVKLSDDKTTLMAWDFNVIADVRDGNVYDFTIEDKNGFKHIRSAVGVVDVNDGEDYPSEWDTPHAHAARPYKELHASNAFSKKESPTGRNRSYALSYAKDLFVGSEITDEIIEGIISIAKRFEAFMDTGE